MLPIILPSVMITQLLLSLRDNKSSIDHTIKKLLEPYAWDLSRQIEVLEKLEEKLSKIDFLQPTAPAMLLLVAIREFRARYLNYDVPKNKPVESDQELTAICMHLEVLSNYKLDFLFVTPQISVWLKNPDFIMTSKGWGSGAMPDLHGIGQRWKEKPLPILNRVTIKQHDEALLLVTGNAMVVICRVDVATKLGLRREKGGISVFPVAILNLFMPSIKLTSADFGGKTNVEFSVEPLEYPIDREPLSFMTPVFEEWKRRIEAKPSFKALIQGSPGSGKTASILGFVKTLGLPVVYTTPDNGQSSLMAITAKAPHDGKRVVVIDDIDRLPPDVIDMLLHAIDSSDAIVFMTSNNIRRLSLAFRRPGRLDQVLEWGKPVKADAELMWRNMGQPFELTQDHWDDLLGVLEKSDLAGLDLYLKTLKSMGPSFKLIEGDITFSQPTSLDENEVYYYDEEFLDEF